MRTRFFTRVVTDAGKSMIGPASSAAGPILASIYKSATNSFTNTDSQDSSVNHEEQSSSFKFK